MARDPYYKALQKAGLGLTREEPGSGRRVEEKGRGPVPPEEGTAGPGNRGCRPDGVRREAGDQGRTGPPFERPWFEIVEEGGPGSGVERPEEDPAAPSDRAPGPWEEPHPGGGAAGGGEGDPALGGPDGGLSGEAGSQDIGRAGGISEGGGPEPCRAGSPDEISGGAELAPVQTGPKDLRPQARTRVAALHLTEPGAERIRELVGASKTAGLSVFESLPSDLERRAMELKPDLILVEYLPRREDLEELIGRLQLALPQVPVMAWSTSRDPEDIIRAVRMGIREYLAEPTTVAAFEEAVVRLASPDRPHSRPTGWLTAVLGAKGGVGTTQLAINLAWAVSQHHGRRVILTDYDPLGGDLAFMLDLESEQGLYDLVHNIDRLDPSFLESVLVEAVPNLLLLPGPTDPVTAEEIKAEEVKQVLDLLRERTEGIVMDVSRRFDDVSLHLLDRADLILVVVEPTVIGLKLARRLVDLFLKLGYGRQKVDLVVNRYDSKFSVGAGDVERALERPVAAWLPNDSRAIIEAGNAGRPVIKETPKGAWSGAVLRMADSLVERLEPRPPGQASKHPGRAGGPERIKRLSGLLKGLLRMEGRPLFAGRR